MWKQKLQEALEKELAKTKKMGGSKIIRPSMGWQYGSASWALSWVSHMFRLLTQRKADKSHSIC